MIIKHPSVTSDVFRLVETFEFDIEINEHFLPTRVELLRDTERSNRYRCRLWERDLYRLRLAGGRAGSGKSDQENLSDEDILVERTWELSDRFEDFEAKDPEDAIRQFLDSLEKYLERVAPVAIK